MIQGFRGSGVSGFRCLGLGFWVLGIGFFEGVVQPDTGFGLSTASGEAL